jgi:hypothetical protein
VVVEVQRADGTLRDSVEVAVELLVMKVRGWDSSASEGVRGL